MQTIGRPFRHFGFLWLVLELMLCGSAGAADGDRDQRTEANVPVELVFTATRPHADPFHDVVLEAVFTEPDGTERRVPAFWAGDQTWKARYASPQSGGHVWRSASNDSQDPGLHGVTGRVEVIEYRGDNPLFRHGPIRVAGNQRHFEHADGTPFFWLGDTWWMGLSHRLHWPDDFQKLAADRKQKGFNIVQIVAGLNPDMLAFDPRGANEAGFPWQKDYTAIRPEYFDAVDLRLRHLVDQGITPCVVGAWGYYMPWMGVEKAQAHWRYLIARYGAWPMVWCAAGEANLPWYLAKGFPFDDREQVHGWTDVLGYIRRTDPWRRPLTIHPTAISQYTARHATDDPALLDFDMLQTPHGQREAVPITIRAARESYEAQPIMPVINGEASFEMLSDSLPTEWTRAMFWLCLTNGTCGHTYGANGIWQVNRRGDPHGASPHGGNYGSIAWDEAMRLPGAEQVALGKKFFESLPWTRLVPMPDGANWAATTEVPALGDWIWFAEGEPRRDAPVEPRFFRRSFEAPSQATVRRAALRVTADDQYTVWLNGKQLGAGTNWKAPGSFDATPLVVPGRNVLAVRAENLKAPVELNPAALNVALDIEFSEGSRQRLTGDAQWRAAKTEEAGWREVAFDDSKWPAAAVVAKYGEAPWGRLEAEPSAAGGPQSCGVEKQLRVVYCLDARQLVVRGLEPGTSYRCTHFDPVTGERTKLAEQVADAQGECRVAPPGHGHDWVVLLESGTALQ
jgi:hypothetical protein